MEDVIIKLIDRNCFKKYRNLLFYMTFLDMNWWIRVAITLCFLLLILFIYIFKGGVGPNSGAVLYFALFYMVILDPLGKSLHYWNSSYHYLKESKKIKFKKGFPLNFPNFSFEFLVTDINAIGYNLNSRFYLLQTGDGFTKRYYPIMKCGEVNTLIVKILEERNDLQVEEFSNTSIFKNNY